MENNDINYVRVYGMSLEELKKTLEHIETVNMYSPFPLYDTEYVSLVKEVIEMREKGKKEDYDNIEVVYCKHCKSLYIEIDEKGNDVCGRCGSVNETDILPNIHEYNKKYKNIWS